MVKLEPGFDADITITNEQTIVKINTEKPAAPVVGKGFTIKSNNDAMVYFFGKFTNELVQKEIDLELSKGKIVIVRNVDDDILLDIGFEGYYPSTILIKSNAIQIGTVHFENIYDQLKGKLVKEEKVYIYHIAGKNKNLDIEYGFKNLANENNDFNIFLIPGNNDKNTVIINNYESEKIMNDIRFCHKDTIVKLYFLNESLHEINWIFTNENFTEISRDFNLFRGNNKITITPNHPIVYSYSYCDKVDEYYFEGDEELWSERTELDNLDIIEAGKNARDNIIKIKFWPNYRQSSTRYIIIIAQKNSQHTFEKFKDPCYITGLLNQRPEGIKVDTIYDIGDRDSVDAEVDISSIKFNDNKYLVNIISQELRFYKRVNFYQPLEFSLETTDGKDQGEGKEGSEIKIVLAVTLPIIAVLIIAIVVIIIYFLKCRRYSIEIESKTQQLM